MDNSVYLGKKWRLGSDWKLKESIFVDVMGIFFGGGGVNWGD